MPFIPADLSRQSDIMYMRYKPKNIDALHIALGGMPDKVRVEVESGIEVSAKTIGEVKVAAWPENLVITTPPELDAESAVEAGPAKAAQAAERRQASRDSAGGSNPPVMVQSRHRTR